jgi:hypothetical protein
MDLLGLLTDQMGHFTPGDIWGVLLGLLLAALFGFVLGKVAGSAEGPDAKALSVLSAVVALAVALVRANVPLSIALVAVALLFRPELPAHGWKARLPLLAAVVVGVGCGSSAGIIVAIAFLPLVLLMRWALNAKSS